MRANMGERIASYRARDEACAKTAEGECNQHQRNERCSMRLLPPTCASARADSHGELSIGCCVEMTWPMVRQASFYGE